jgi:two-component sensor histidine kinase
MGLSLIENMAQQMDATISMVQGQGVVYHIAMPGGDA